MPNVSVHPHDEIGPLAGSRAIALLGVGPDASRLFCNARERGVSIPVVVSNNPGHWGRQFEGCPVISIGAAVRRGITTLLVAPGTEYVDAIETLSLRGTAQLDVYASGALASPTSASIAGNNTIMNEALHHARGALMNPALSTLPRASNRWQAYLQRIANELDDITTVREAILYGQRRIGFNHRCEVTPALVAGSAVDESLLRSRFPEFDSILSCLQESPHSDPTTTFLLDGKWRSNVFFGVLQTFFYGLKYAAGPSIVAEIGSGTGDLARLWLDNPIHRPTCVLIDWPQSLFFAEVFLRKNLPALQVRYVTDDQPIQAEALEPGELVLCPLQNLGALRELHLDLVINSGSLQEMTEAWVDFFMTWLSQQRCHRFYSANYFAQPLDFMAEGANSWSPRLGREWRVVHQHLETGARSFAVIIAEKSTAARELSRHDAQTAFERLRRAGATPTALLDAMDLFRLHPDAGLAWAIVEWCLAAPGFVPKELWYLANFITTTSDGSRFPGFAGIYSRLNTIRNNGVEDLLPEPI